jgi:hypothetical protein
MRTTKDLNPGAIHKQVRKAIGAAAGAHALTAFSHAQKLHLLQSARFTAICRTGFACLFTRQTKISGGRFMYYHFKTVC